MSDDLKAFIQSHNKKNDPPPTTPPPAEKTPAEEQKATFEPIKDCDTQKGQTL